MHAGRLSGVIQAGQFQTEGTVSGQNDLFDQQSTILNLSALVRDRAVSFQFHSTHFIFSSKLLVRFGQ